MTIPLETSLHELADPRRELEGIEVTQYSQDELNYFYKTMCRIRTVEQVLAQLVLDNEVKCPCHLGVGQEAVSVGVSHALKTTDYAFGNHRSHAHYLALGGELEQLMAEVFGKVTGCSKGMGGSMHIFTENSAFKGAVPIVAGTISIAVGAGIAAKMDGKQAISIAYFGDGASEEGTFHESLNLAGIYNLPVLFVCENNLYSSHLDINMRQRGDRIARFADAHKIPSRVVDGNNITEVENAARELVKIAREGKGPVFLEAVTYRWLGHVGPHENIDVGVRRSREEIDAWKLRDPIKRLADAMVASKIATLDDLREIQVEVDNEVNQAVIKARNAPYPEKSALLDLVYA